MLRAIIDEDDDRNYHCLAASFSLRSELAAGSLLDRQSSHSGFPPFGHVMRAIIPQLMAKDILHARQMMPRATQAPRSMRSTCSNQGVESQHVELLSGLALLDSLFDDRRDLTPTLPMHAGLKCYEEWGIVVRFKVRG